MSHSEGEEGWASNMVGEQYEVAGHRPSWRHGWPVINRCSLNRWGERLGTKGYDMI